MELNPYVFYHGNCAEALAFYEAAGLGKAGMTMTWSQGPADMQMPPNWGDKIMHARFEGDGIAFMAADTPEADEGHRGFSISLGMTDLAQAEKLFASLSAGGTVRMPMAPTFWGAHFGMFTDKFGVGWMINCEIKQ